MNDLERDKAKHEGVWQFVCELDLFRLKLITLTQGRRASLLLRDLLPLEQAAREWAQSKPGEHVIGNCKAEAYEIMCRLFAEVREPADLAPKLRRLHPAPAEYDDSEIALGRQRIAQLERMQQSEARRTKSAEDKRMHMPVDSQQEQAPGAQEPADAWREL